MSVHIKRYLWGRAEFETNINRITVDICAFSPSSTITSPLPSSPSSSPSPPPASRVNQATSPSPLLRDVGSIKTASAPQKRRPGAAAPPLSTGMWAASIRSTGELGREGDKGELIKWEAPLVTTATGECRGRQRRGRRKQREGGGAAAAARGGGGAAAAA